MQRREFITLLGGAAAAWPLAAHAQQPERIRRIGVLIGPAEDDPEMKARLAAFRQRLEKRGWSEGRNVHIETRFAADSKSLQPARERAGRPATGRDPRAYDAGCRRVAAGEPRLSRLCSSTSPTPLAQVSSRPWRGRAEISPACCSTRRASLASGWRCSRRSRLALSAWLSGQPKDNRL